MIVNWAKFRVYAVLTFFWLFLSFAVWFGMEAFLHFAADGGVDDAPARTGLDLWFSRLTLPLTLVVFGLVIFWRTKSVADLAGDEDGSGEEARDAEDERT